MKTDKRIEYHLGELEIAMRPDSPYRAMPTFGKNDRSILDIGCGIGQTFVASNPDGERLLVGMDPDMACLDYGKRHFDSISYVQGVGEALPFREDSFDMVISRVALPYTNIPKALREIRRVVKKDGNVWLLLHPLSMAFGDLRKAAVSLSFKKMILQIYVIGNGAIFHVLGKMFPFPFSRRYESFQTAHGIQKAMERVGFGNVVINIRIAKEKHFIVTADKGV